MSTATETPILWTTQQLSEYLGRSHQALERDRRLGQGVPYIKIAHHVRYKVNDVLNYLEQNTVKSNGEG